VFGTNAVGQGQFFTKYEIAGPITTPQLTISSGPFSFVSLDKFTVDVLYSNTGFASDTAVAVPEPSGIAGILGLGMCGWLRRRRR
ncbi:MAG: PEP-CTERM sorting domain-containing protein, partial [Planctomycetota bacterium]